MRDGTSVKHVRWLNFGCIFQLEISTTQQQWHHTNWRYCRYCYACSMVAHSATKLLKSENIFCHCLQLNYSANKFLADTYQEDNDDMNFATRLYSMISRDSVQQVWMNHFQQAKTVSAPLASYEVFAPAACRISVDWWKAYGGEALPLQKIAKRITSLCCSSFGCEHNWSTFEFIHTKKRNRLEHQKLNDLVYVQYNTKISSRFQKLKSEGKKFNPLLLEEFQWTNEWVDKDIAQVHGGDDDLSWAHVDEAIGASRSLRGRNVPRRARGNVICYSRRQDSSSTSNTHEEDSDNEEEDVCDDEEIEDDFGQQPSTTEQMDEGNANDDEHLDVFMLDDE